MDYEFDEMWDGMYGLDSLELYYEAHAVGCDGECVNFNIYFESVLTDEKFEEIDKAIENFVHSYGEDVYLGYLDVSEEEDKVRIYLDLGNVEPEYEEVSIHGILEAINKVSGIKLVLINE